MDNLFQNGSIWLRADFHLHTRADAGFPYSGAENDFVNKYVDKLVEQDIRVGVISNHNKFDKHEFMALKKKASEKGTGLFPGVEFSLKEGIHCLIVFEEAWYKGQTDEINSFLSSAFYGVENPATPSYPNSAFDLKEVVEKLDKIGHNYFIILAHVDANNGLFQELRGRNFDAFVKQGAFNKVLALQKSGNLDHYNRLCEQAGRQIACVEGSDNAHEGIEGIGKGRKTFLKIGDFNFEAIYFALLDFQNRIKPKEVPEIYNSYIKSIAFDGGLLNGKTISFSPGLNNLIGIRGSGKSAILEILRYALSIPLGTQALDKEYKNDLIRHALKSGGKVIVEVIDKYGKQYTVKRIYDKKEDIYVNGTLKQDITLNAILQQPIYFGQKDLSNKNADFENDLVNKLIGAKLNDIHSKIDDKKREIQRIIDELKNLGDLSQLRKETEITLTNAAYQLQVFEEKGVSEKLQQQTSFESDINLLQNRHAEVDAFIGDLNSLIQNYEYSTSQHVSSSVNAELFEVANLLLQELKGKFEQLKTLLSNSQTISASFEALINKLVAKREELKDEFARIKREINIPELNPDDFIKLNRVLEISKLKLIEIDKLINKRIELNSQLNEAVHSLDSLWHERYKLLSAEVSKINRPDSKLSICINYKGRKENKSQDRKENTFQTKLQESFKGSNIREYAYKEMIDAYTDFIDMYKDEFHKLTDILNENQLTEFKTRFQANLYDLLTYQVENEIIIEFEGKPLKEHSLGQRASALILFLLSQHENDILIIDQPEDDLDNQTIYNDVIKEIIKLKGKMQFLFATHNANIPVLGYSEMLIACQYVPDTEILIESGSMDCTKIQEKIVEIMEGGKEAFDRRKNIYQIWERNIV